MKGWASILALQRTGARCAAQSSAAQEVALRIVGRRIVGRRRSLRRRHLGARYRLVVRAHAPTLPAGRILARWTARRGFTPSSPSCSACGRTCARRTASPRATCRRWPGRPTRRQRTRWPRPGQPTSAWGRRRSDRARSLPSKTMTCPRCPFPWGLAGYAGAAREAVTNRESSRRYDRRGKGGP
jgi:hypothetical protein